MGRRGRSGYKDFIQGFVSTYGIGRKVAEDFRNDQVARDLAAVDGDFTPTQTEVASGEEALAAAQQARDQAIAGADTQEQKDKATQDYAPTISAMEQKRATPAGVVQSLGTGPSFRQQEAPFSQQEIDGAKARRRADIYSSAGREDDAARVLINETRRRDQADQEELRAALSPRSQAPLLATGATDLPDATGNAQPTSAAGAPTAAGVAAGKGIPGAGDPLPTYLKQVAPKVVQTLVKNGHIEDAKRFSDFMESQDGQVYARSYMNGVRRFAVGDHEGAMAHFEKLYNDDLYPDGRRVKLTPLEGGQMRIDQFDAEGKQVGTRTGKIADLTEMAALALNPLQAVKFMAEQGAKRKAEAAALDRQVELERLRQEGQETREDRRDARTRMQLDAQARALDKRLEGAGVLTATQRRQNAEIEAARAAIGDLDPTEIKRRTSTFLESGRNNDEFDPTLAAQVKLARRRMVGQDDWFDERAGQSAPVGQQKPAPQAGAIDRAEVGKRFRADPQNNPFKLGNPATVTTKDGRKLVGVEVLDKSGRVVGYFE